MNKGQFLVGTHLRTGRPVGELARAHGVSRGWMYKLPCPLQPGGPGRAGAAVTAAAPLAHPDRGPGEEDIVALRKELAGAGLDAGAETIQVHLARRHPAGPLGLHDLAGAQGPRLCHPVKKGVATRSGTSPPMSTLRPASQLDIR